MSQTTLTDTDHGRDSLVDEDKLSRARSALDELEAGEMSIESNDDGTFEVKGDYEVDPDVPSCTCADHEYRNQFCKHIVAVSLQLTWGNIEQQDDESDVPPRPDVLDVKPGNVPHTLRGMDHWVCWEQQLIENKDGSQRWTKVPIDVETGSYASSTDPDTWTTYENALAFYKRDDTDVVGIGFVVGDDDAVLGIDIDDCRDPDSGDIDEPVVKFLRETETYAEVSPSGTGLRIFVLGEMERDGNEADLPGEAHIEMYHTGRYLTVTGQHIEYTDDDVTWDEDTVTEFDKRTADAKEDSELSEFGA